jgi:hypothetical protein
MSTNSWHQYSIIKLLQHRIIFWFLLDYSGYIPAYWGRCATRCLWISHSLTVEKHHKVVWTLNKSANLRFWKTCQWIAVSLDHPFPRTVMPWVAFERLRCLKFKVQLFQWFRYVFEKRFCDLRGREAERLGVAHSSLNTQICKVSRTWQVCHRTLPRWGLRVMEFSDSIADAVGTFRGLFQSSIWVLSIPH